MDKPNMPKLPKVDAASPEVSGTEDEKEEKDSDSEVKEEEDKTKIKKANMKNKQVYY